MSAEFQWTDDDIPLLMEATQNLKVEKDYKGLNWKLILGLTLDCMLVILLTNSMKSFHHFKLRCGLTQKRGGEHLLSFFRFCIFESELISSNSLNLFRTNITVRTRSNSTKKLYWLCTKEIITLTTHPTSLLRPMFYLRPTVIYVLVFFTFSCFRFHFFIEHYQTFI